MVIRWWPLPSFYDILCILLLFAPENKHVMQFVRFQSDSCILFVPTTFTRLDSLISESEKTSLVLVRRFTMNSITISIKHYHYHDHYFNQWCQTIPFIVIIIISLFYQLYMNNSKYSIYNLNYLYVSCSSFLVIWYFTSNISIANKINYCSYVWIILFSMPVLFF